MNIVGITGQAGSGKDTLADHLVTSHNFQKMALADPIKRFGLHVFEFDEIQLWGPSSARNTFDPRYVEANIRSNGIKLSEKTLSAVTRACDRGWSTAAKNLLEYGPGWLQKVLPGCDVAAQMDTLCFWFVSLSHKYPDLSPRIMLQTLGTEWGRHVADENIWLDMLLREAEIVLKGGLYSRTDGARVAMCEITPPTGIVCSDVRFGNEVLRIRDVGGRVVRILRPDTDAKASKTGVQGHVSEIEQKTFTADQLDAIINNDGSLDALYSRMDAVLAS